MASRDTKALFSHETCPSCESARMTEQMIIEQVPVGEGDEYFEAEVPVVTCLDCEFSFTDHRAEKIRHAAHCRHEKVLAPEEVKAVREALGMTRREFAEAYGLPPASMERWENGRLIQNTSLDTLLRALQNPTTAARLDRRRSQELVAAQPKVVTGRFRAL